MIEAVVLEDSEFEHLDPFSTARTLAEAIREHQNEVWRNAGVKTVVTPCADCYAAFSVLHGSFMLI